MNYSLRKLLLIGVGAEILIFLVSYFLYPSIEETFRHAARYSGRLSALIFLITFYLFAVSKPAPLLDNSSLRKLIVVFAVLHIIHFGFLASNVYLNSIPLEAVKVVGGALAYLMIVVAPFKLHQLHFRFQLIYFYYVSFVMIMTYIARIKGDFLGADPFWFHYLMLSILIICAVVFGWWLGEKSAKTTSS